jgi:hypothetical protein
MALRIGPKEGIENRSFLYVRMFGQKRKTSVSCQNKQS